MKHLTIFIFTILCFTSLQAQVVDDPNKDSGNKTYDWTWKQNNPVTFTPPPPDPVPVDGGLSLLLIAGAGVGLRELRKRK